MHVEGAVLGACNLTHVHHHVDVVKVDILELQRVAIRIRAPRPLRIGRPIVAFETGNVCHESGSRKVVHTDIYIQTHTCTHIETYTYIYTQI
jgi:Ni2+-binding GTPase involved in maturation of urease and hydrogenase